MKFYSKLIRYIFISIILLGLFAYAQGDEHFFPHYPADTPTGTISGKILPSDVPVFIWASQRNSKYGGIGMMNTTKGTFTTTPVPVGTYDLIIVPFQRPYYGNITPAHAYDNLPTKDQPYYNVIGQYVNPAYQGNTLTAQDKLNMQNMINSLSELQDRTYNTKNLNLLSESTILAKNYINYDEDSVKGLGLPRLKQWITSTTFKFIKASTKRKFWLIGGNQNKTFVIDNLVIEVEGENQAVSRNSEGKLVRGGPWYHKIETYVFDELIYLDKQNGQWVISVITPINEDKTDYMHMPSFWSGYVIYTISGPLVGIKVSQDKDTMIGVYTLPKINNFNLNMVRPYRFEHKEVK